MYVNIYTPGNLFKFIFAHVLLIFSQDKMNIVKIMTEVNDRVLCSYCFSFVFYLIHLP